VLQFTQIWDFLKTKLHAEFDETSLLKSIQTVATLVQGCWVVRSEIAYGDEFLSAANGIAGPLMQRARDITVRLALMKGIQKFVHFKSIILRH